MKMGTIIKLEFILTFYILNIFFKFKKYRKDNI